MLGSAEVGNAVTAQFMALTPGCFTADENGGRASEEFQATLAAMLEAATPGRDTEGLGGKARAAAVVAWMHRTRPPKILVPYVDEPAVEIERRASSYRSRAISTAIRNAVALRVQGSRHAVAEAGG